MRDATDLAAVFRALARPNLESGSNVFAVAAISETPHRLGKDGSGAPALLVHVDGGPAAPAGPVVLQHIAVQHDVRCRLVRNDDEAAARTELVSLVRCVSGEPALRDYFVSVVEVAVRQLGGSPSRAEVSRAIKRLTELFRAFEQPARRTVQGLWAELALIAMASDPAALVSAWHVDPDEAFDFSSGAVRIEMKSFGGVARVHSFSLRQARPGSGVDAVVASMRAERSSGGTSIADLLAVLKNLGVPAPSLEKAELVVAESLGESAAAGLSITFDLQRARESLRFFDATAVPSIDPNLPPGVVSVRFEALLDEATALALTDLRRRGSIFASAVPADALP